MNEVKNERNELASPIGSRIFGNNATTLRKGKLWTESNTSKK